MLKKKSLLLFLSFMFAAMNIENVFACASSKTETMSNARRSLLKEVDDLETSVKIQHAAIAEIYKEALKKADPENKNAFSFDIFFCDFHLKVSSLIAAEESKFSDTNVNSVFSRVMPIKTKLETEVALNILHQPFYKSINTKELLDQLASAKKKDEAIVFLNIFAEIFVEEANKIFNVLELFRQEELPTDEAISEILRIEGLQN